MVGMEARITYHMLRGLRIGDDRARRALMLARRASLVVDEGLRIVVAVPSQRRGLIRPAKKASHADLAAILRGEYVVREAEIGELPVEEQVYMVEVTPQGARCGCPDTLLGGDPLCVHKLAAAVYIADRLEARRAADLLSWLPHAALRYRVWRRRRAMRRASPISSRGHALAGSVGTGVRGSEGSGAVCGSRRLG